MYWLIHGSITFKPNIFWPCDNKIRKIDLHDKRDDTATCKATAVHIPVVAIHTMYVCERPDRVCGQNVRDSDSEGSCD